MKSEELWLGVNTDIYKASGSDKHHYTPILRLYCTSADEAWSLQVRGPLKRADGRDGADFVIACARMRREDMIALRDAIDRQLEEYAEFRENAACTTTSNPTK